MSPLSAVTGERLWPLWEVTAPQLYRSNNVHMGQLLHTICERQFYFMPRKDVLHFNGDFSPRRIFLTSFVNSREIYMRKGSFTSCPGSNAYAQPISLRRQFYCMTGSGIRAGRVGLFWIRWEESSLSCASFVYSSRHHPLYCLAIFRIFCAWLTAHSSAEASFTRFTMLCRASLTSSARLFASLIRTRSWIGMMKTLVFPSLMSRTPRVINITRPPFSEVYNRIARASVPTSSTS